MATSMGATVLAEIAQVATVLERTLLAMASSLMVWWTMLEEEQQTKPLVGSKGLHLALLLGYLDQERWEWDWMNASLEKPLAHV